MNTQQILFEVGLVGDCEFEVASSIILATMLYFLCHRDLSLFDLLSSLLGVYSLHTQKLI